MTKKRFLIFTIVILAISFYFQRLTSEKSPFLQIPVSFFPFVDRPTMNIQIEGKKYAVLIDLGSSHFLDLQKDLLDKVKSKRFAGTFKYVGMRGNSYDTDKFELSEMKISDLSVKSFDCFEENPAFRKDAKTWDSQGFWDHFKDGLDSFIIKGRIGFPLFTQFDCFLDFPNSRLCLAPNLFSKHKCLLDSFTQVPFQIQKNGIALEIVTEEGSKKFILDTGATKSILKNRDLGGAKNKDLKLLRLEIGSKDFGEWEFIVYQFTDKFECDGILGVDFLKKHAVGLDFSNQVAYIK